MASKRTATSDLTRENWNEEETPEEAGVFTKASEDVLEKRVIRSARRRLASGETKAKSAFGAFAGFKTSTETSLPPFSFLGSAATPNSTVSSSTSFNTGKSTTSNGASKSVENGAEKLEGSSNDTGSSKTQVVSNTPSIQKGSNKKGECKVSKSSSNYFAKLKGLNESVSRWIKTHVDKNPFCILTPIFRDYEKHLKEIESNHGLEKMESSGLGKSKASSSSEKVKETGVAAKPAESTSFASMGSKSVVRPEWKPEKTLFSNVDTSKKSIFGSTEQTLSSSPKSVFSSDQKVDTQKSIFGNIEAKSDMKSVFGNISSEKNPFFSKSSTALDNKTDEGVQNESKGSPSLSFPQTAVSTATFSFGQSSAANTASAGFSFGSAKPFSFGAQVTKPQDPDEKNETEDKDEEDEVPKPDFKPVTEEGAVFEQRCKVFIKKDGSFSNRGIGILFLKPTPSAKTQLIVRADTSLATLLLNILLTESIPTKRVDKNTVMMMCLPLPSSEPPPTAVLLRVKTEADADSLYDMLNKHKK